MARWGLIGQDAVLSRLEEAGAEGRLAHGLLFAGPVGTGKGSAARELARRLLCRTPGAMGRGACGECRGCQLAGAGSHPDWLTLEAEPGKEIRVDAVRELGRAAQLTPQEGAVRVALVEPAEALNAYAANALLKNLEEPPGGLVFLLVSHRPERLLPTIRSRCQLVPFRALPRAELAEWLQRQLGLGGDEAALLAGFSGGCPGQALQRSQSDLRGQRDELVADLDRAARGDLAELLEVAKRRAEGDPADWLPLARVWLQDWVRVTVAGLDAARSGLVNGDRAEEIARRAQSGYDWPATGLSALGHLAEQMEGPANSRLALEDFLLRWREAAPRAGAGA
jgi:DNA polymerase-3 subunit delta'